MTLKEIPIYYSWPILVKSSYYFLTVHSLFRGTDLFSLLLAIPFDSGSVDLRFSLLYNDRINDKIHESAIIGPQNDNSSSSLEGKKGRETTYDFRLFAPRAIYGSGLPTIR